MRYIVPREKPNRCTNCPFMDRITYDCKLMYGDDYPDFESQYEHCPLVEIPTPHGRLIDADKLANETFYGATSAPYITYRKFVNAPIVIEAEGET